MTGIELDELGKSYDQNVEAVRKVSIDIVPGEFLVLVGPSGCGKSTILRMIAGLESISSGELRFDGQRMNEVEARNRDIGMVFQNYALYPHMTVAENIAFPLRVRKESEQHIQQRVSEVAAMLSIDSLLQRKPKQLSGGQRQRVALGRAIARQPRVFLFDEPLSNLDARLRIETRAELSQLQRRLGTTSVYVTHDHVEAMTMGQRIAVLRGGELQQLGTPLELYSNPDTAFVASFLGSSGMNFFEGRLERQNGLLFVGDAFDLRLKLEEKHFRRGIPQAGQRMRLGLRAEQIVPVEHQADFKASVVVREYVGHESLIYVRDLAANSDLLCIRAAADFSLSGSSQQNFKVQSDSLFLFDSEGLRL